MAAIAEIKSKPLESEEVGIDSLLELLEKCSDPKSKPSDIKALREMLKDNPKIWNYVGDLSSMARNRIIEKGINASPALLETTKAGMKLIEKDLGFETASPIEKLLIKQIVTCWLHNSIVEYQYASTTGYDNKLAIEVADYWERKKSSAQRMYLRSIESLARVRKLIRPDPNPLQLNIAEKQINIAAAPNQQPPQKAG